MAALIALSTLLLAQPNLLAKPSQLFLANVHTDFGHAIQIARGEILQPWTLVDYHAIPYLYQWTHLLPLTIGTVASGLGAIAVIHSLRARTTPRIALLSWIIMYFLLVGGLFSKSVRHVSPIIPAIAILTADLLARVWSNRRPLGILLMAGLLVPTTASGISFGRVYLEEDSRLQASRWIEQNLPPKSVLGLEAGGFPLHRLLDDPRLEKTWLGLPHIFYASPYLLCTTRLDLLRQRLEKMDYFAIVDANRMAQYRAVPDLFPVVAGFYERLNDGQLGIELVRRYKVSPRLFGVDFDDSGSEPSFIGYDHPAVLVYRMDKRKMDGSLETWRREFINDVNCSDRLLFAAADRLTSGDYSAAAEQVGESLFRYPRAKTAYLLRAEILSAQGKHAASEEARRQYRPESGSGGTLHASSHGTIHLIPGSSALSLVELGLDDLAIRVLEEGTEQAHRYTDKATESMVVSYSAVAERLFEKGRLEETERALELSLQIRSTPVSLNALGTLAYRKGKTALAVERWTRSLAIRDAQPQIHVLIGKASLELGQPKSAYDHLRRALFHDPSMGPHLQPWLARAGALTREP